MDNAEKVINELCSDKHIETPDIQKLENLRDEEIARDNPDFELIDEITRTILELKNIPEHKVDIDFEIQTLRRKGIKHHRKIKFSKFASVAVVATAVIVANLFASPFVADSVRNFFPSMYTGINGIFLDFNDANESNNNAHVLPTEQKFHDIKEFTTALGLDVYVPTEGMPDGDSTMDVTYKNSKDLGISVEFKIDASYYPEDGGRQQRTIGIIYYVVDDHHRDNKIIEFVDGDVLDSGFLTDGMDTYVFFDRKAAEWPDSSLLYHMYFYEKISEDKGILTIAYTIGLDHDEAYKIFKSFK